jgi:hypothetical protein
MTNIHEEEKAKQAAIVAKRLEEKRKEMDAKKHAQIVGAHADPASMLNIKATIGERSTISPSDTPQGSKKPEGRGMI